MWKKYEEILLQYSLSSISNVHSSNQNHLKSPLGFFVILSDLACQKKKGGKEFGETAKNALV